jgi:hypothetical protein
LDAFELNVRTAQNLNHFFKLFGLLLGLTLPVMKVKILVLDSIIKGIGLNIFKFNQEMSTFDESIYLARVAEQADRFEDMIDFLQVLADKSEDLKVEERNLLSVAFKNAVGQRRTAWRAVSAIE